MVMRGRSMSYLKQLEQAAELLKPSEFQHPNRFEYYHPSQDIVLFQKFHSSKVPEARVIRNKDNEWGFYLPNIQKWLPFEEGVREYQLKPVYPIHQSTLEYKGYVQLEIPKDAIVFYPFVDYLYETWGMENMRLREQDHTILLFIRRGKDH